MKGVCGAEGTIVAERVVDPAYDITAIRAILRRFY